jgi:phosphotriesterase-related protein
MINTVSGAVSSKDIGKTLIHEHFLFGMPGYNGDVTLGAFDYEAALEKCKQEISKIQKLGVNTVVDGTPNECGRDPAFLKALSQATGINIVCSTGYYNESSGAAPYFNERAGFTCNDIVREICETFVTEISNGIAQSGVKAGIIKIATSYNNISDFERKVFLAAAAAQKETGVPIITHTHEGTMGEEQADLLIAEGANPNKIIIGHMDGNRDISYHIRILKRGVNISLDRFGLRTHNFPQDDERIALLLGLIGAGYEKQIMLSHDTVNWWLGRKRNYTKEIMESHKTYHMAHVIADIVPELLAAGVSQKTIETLFVENPARVLDIS